MAQRFDELADKIELLERIVHLLSGDVPAPLLVEMEGQGRAFRFAQPNIKHFVFLHFSRIVSSINATVILARFGYSQELASLIRSIYEFTFKISYVSNGYFDPKLKEKTKLYVRQYFEDFSRKPGVVDKDTSPRQKEINVALGHNDKWLKEISGMTAPASDTAAMRYHLLSVYSNYLHGRYPELMDMYGRQPPEVHIRGMAQTPKDNENFLQLEATIDSVLLTIKNYVRRFGYHSIEATPDDIRSWANDI
jgi:hypothetical protein